MLELQRYDFKLIYRPGKELYIADTPTRTCQLQRQSRHDEREEEDDPLKDIYAVIIHSGSPRRRTVARSPGACEEGMAECEETLRFK